MSTHDARSRRPLPARLCLLEQVRQQELGSKIRFLGCVHAYRIEAGTLLLRTEFPANHSRCPTVAIQLNSVLESINNELTEVGAWLNVVGVVQPPLVTLKPRKFKGDEQHRAVHRVRRMPVVNATMIWSAGAIRLDKYQTAARAIQCSMSVSEK